MAWRPPDLWSYSYLLGMYLGDGCVTGNGPSYQLVVACDAAYPDIIEDCATAMTLTLLPRRVACNPHPVHRCVRVVGSSRRWPEAFPQHGAGRKHDRKIELADWQREVVDRSADIRGLFCEYCERLGIRWTQSNPRNISVSHRRSVALLDSFVPAKS
jgi:hypothetical protein